MMIFMPAASADPSSNNILTLETQLSNQPINDYQIKWLQFAFDATSKIPHNPHIKTRSRQQEAVVKTCLELNQPLRALHYISQIDNWRRHLSYAHLAFYCAEHGKAELAQAGIALAWPVADNLKKWRRDRVRVKIAQTYILLNRLEKAEVFSAGLDPAEIGKTAQINARTDSAIGYEAQLKQLRSLLQSKHFDVLKNGLFAMAELYSHAYDRPNRRVQIYEILQQSWQKIPGFYRIELLTKLADAALQHGDPPQALRLVNEAHARFSGFEWPLEQHIKVQARLAEYFYQAGDPQTAREKAEEGLALYNENSGQIVDIWRADALRPLAEAFYRIGEQDTALAVYKQAIEAGAANPNSRPRAEDLSATCRSMALHAVQPNKKLWERMHSIYEGLDHPW